MGVWLKGVLDSGFRKRLRKDDWIGRFLRGKTFWDEVHAEEMQKLFFIFYFF